jgi:hypothetical protein
MQTDARAIFCAQMRFRGIFKSMKFVAISAFLLGVLNLAPMAARR